MTLTPKEKAKQLVDKFRNEFKWVEIDHNVDLYRDTRQCALILVNEILNVLYSVQNRDRVGFEYLGDIVDGHELSDFFEQIQNDLTNP